jgi:DNA helicase-2/ATP-dependent DNA helicase PcrA
MRRYTLQTSTPSPLRLDYESSLNAEQRAVVMAPPGPILVLAGAGSGKTRALTYRVARLLETGLAPHEILLLTFTNRAATEMLQRASQLAQVDLSRMWGGTFHHVGNLVLRDHAEVLGYGKDFGILDREDSKELMEACIAECGQAVGQRRFPKGDVVVDLYSTAVNLQVPLMEAVAKRTPQFLALEEPLIRVARRYVERKQQLNVMDFDDLLLNWKRLLAEHPVVAEKLQRRFRAVLVDEYQDVNKLQADIVDHVSALHRHLLVVGDDAQCIYSFRGSDVDSILRFPERYPDAQTHKLTINYRSTPQILALANASIARNSRQFPKQLRPMRGDREAPALVSLRDVQQQAEFVAQRLMELRDEGFSLKDMAVLYRAHHHSMELQLELARRGIPFVVRSGVRFFEQAHVKDVMAFLKWVDNPRDELSFKRMVKLFPGLGSATADTLWDALAMATQKGEDARVAFTHRDFSALCPPKGRAGLARLRGLLAELCAPAMQSTPAQMVDRILHEGSYREYLRSRFPNAQAREDDVAQLASYALQFEGLSQFVSELSLAGELQGEDVVEGEEPDEKLTLSSIHQAKGLEWRAVFVLWVSEGRFPSPPSLKTLEGEEEERRLFYVAVTRAKDELYLLHPVFHVERDHTRTILRPSRFVAELDAPGPAPLFERWTIEEAPRPGAPALDGTPDAPRMGPAAPPTNLPPNVTPLFGPRK